MVFDNGYELTLRKNGDIYTNLTTDKGHVTITKAEDAYNTFVRLYQTLADRQNPLADRNTYVSSINIDELWANGTLPNDANATPIKPLDAVKSAITGMMKFFTEFDFQPNFRFLNTLSRYGAKNATEYISNYFELTNSPYASVIAEKLKSREFKAILKNFFATTTNKEINKRFKLYYGAQGTGKTTKALAETGGACMVCHNAMLPNDLMEDFTFDNGNATFKPSALALAMMNGTKIVLDEINLLPFESLRFLQGVLDGKASFEYKGNTVNIKDGFEIIGTMNLTVNGMTYGLPEPLVDRCSETRKFKLSADDLIGAI